jgi:protein-L-isoaspartate(D-aspartate) O-methyltransferase
MRALLLVFFFLAVFPVTGARTEERADYSLKRERLIREQIAGEGIKDAAVIRSMLEVPREEFVPVELRRRAYGNEPLPIGYGQTISQPYIVALMTELLAVNGEDSVLEVGTGSGYQAAVLSRIARRVYSIEIIEPLGKRAKEALDRLGYDNVVLRTGDGYFGWEEHAPYDAIIVTAAADHIPPPLVAQLKKGGRMCIPVGEPYFPQVLKLVEKDGAGNVRVRDILPVVFVPLTRAWKGAQ